MLKLFNGLKSTPFFQPHRHQARKLKLNLRLPNRSQKLILPNPAKKARPKSQKQNPVRRLPLKNPPNKTTFQSPSLLLLLKLR